jgi:hydrogenase small subunit
MNLSKRRPSTYEVLRANGVDRRAFLAYCTKTAALMGLSAAMVPRVVNAFVTQPRIPVIWMHGLECTGCSESILRSANPTIADVILNLISLDYHATLQAAAGFQAEAIRQRIMRESPGQYLLAVEGGTPTSRGGVHCTIAGRSFLELLKETAAGARAVVAWGACASYGGVQAAQPNPTGAKAVSDLISSAPVINVPGCPPIAEVMTGVIAYVLVNGALPDLDSQNRPIMFYGSTVHDTCARKSFYDAGQFVRNWDDSGARSGWCLYRMGCRGPETHNACSDLMWNEGVSSCTHAGHPCIGCSEKGFWDKGPLYGASARRERDDDDDEHEDDAVETRIGG